MAITPVPVSYPAADAAKLAGIATGATANSSDAALRARSSHTGTQAASTISDFDTEVANNSAVAANTAKTAYPGDGAVDHNALDNYDPDEHIDWTSTTANLDTTGSAEAKSLGTQGPIDNGNISTSATIDWTAGNHQKATITGDVTLSFTAPSQGTATLIIALSQDGTGGFTVTLPGTVEWPRGVAPELSETANAKDLLSFYWDGTAYHASYGPAYA